MARRSSKTSQTSVSQEQTNEMIQKKAQEIYEKSGRKPGRDMDNWLEAERIVKRQP
ncbi:MAG: DUF2934 domain-containing protein [Candidatus Omnitrophica bacterium]|nr:DUF2934 domain-containing protein [Candidatus Omnitrophota bacterium]MBU1809512.1 DUF2934 domain-containing protein [Candidatus Omnitrophota bacterium]